MMFTNRRGELQRPALLDDGRSHNLWWGGQGGEKTSADGIRIECVVQGRNAFFIYMLVSSEA